MSVKVIVVDDDRNMGDLIYRKFRQKILEGACEFVFAYDGLEALAKLRLDPEIAVLVTDIHMPKMNGLELLEQVKKLELPIQIVVMSAYSDIQNIRAAMNLGAFDFLFKPLDFQDLTVTINKTLKKVREAEENRQFRQQKSEELYQAEAKYRSIFEHAVEGIFQSTFDGRFLAVNPAMASIMRYPSPLQMIECITDIATQLYVHPNRRQEFQHMLQLQDEVKGFESQVYCQDGSRIWISENARVVRDRNLNVLYYEGFIMDITERISAQESLQRAYQELEIKVEENIPFSPEPPIKLERFLQMVKVARRTVLGINNQLMMEIAERQRSEEAVRQSEERFRATFEQAAVGICHCSLDGQFLWFNQKLCEIADCDREQLYDRTLLQMMHADDANDFLSSLHLVWTQQAANSSVKMRFLRQTNHSIWANLTISLARTASGAPQYLICVIEDITARQIAEEALQRSNSLLQAQKEAAIDGILAVDEQGRIFSYNRRFCEMWAIPESLLSESEEFCLLSHLLSIVPLPKEFVAIVEKVYNQPETPSHDEILLEDDRVFDCYSGPVISPAGKFYGMIWYFRDITERVRAGQALQLEKDKSERLLLNILPHAIAERLKQENGIIADSFPEVTVLFADIVDFTRLSVHISPTEMVGLLNRIFSVFDDLAEQHGLEKIKTIGDAYMVVGGLPDPRSDHVEAIANMALDMQREILQFTVGNNNKIRMRIGINTGPVVAGVIGTKKFIYDLWGDTVNIANRMESQGLAGCIQVTGATYERLQNSYVFDERGSIQVKGKGEMNVYILRDKR